VNMLVENPDGSSLKLNSDIRDIKRHNGAIIPGPFSNLTEGANNFTLKLKSE